MKNAIRNGAHHSYARFPASSGTKSWDRGDEAARDVAFEAATSHKPLEKLSGLQFQHVSIRHVERFHTGRLVIWGGFGEEDADGDRRAYIKPARGQIMRLLGWEGRAAAKDFVSDAEVTLLGRRSSGPVMDFFVVESLLGVAPARSRRRRNHGTHSHDGRSEGGESGRRSLLQAQGVYQGQGPTPRLGMRVLVVRPRLPAGCSTNTLVGGCNATVRRG